MDSYKTQVYNTSLYPATTTKHCENPEDDFPFSSRHQRQASEKGSNQIKVKHLKNISSQEQESKNLNQLCYAVKCFTDFQFDKIVVLSRGPAVQRGIQLMVDTEQSVKKAVKT